MHRLSQRELEVARLVAQGLTNKQIGRELFITAGTVGNHLKNIYRKLDINTRVRLAVTVTQKKEGD